jgi:hypothetical protein
MKVIQRQFRPKAGRTSIYALLDLSAADVTETTFGRT